MPSQQTAWPLLDFYRAWLHWVESTMLAVAPPAQEYASFAPASLTQPINPGWIFGSVHITNENSADPAAEHRILETASYGRQLGRLMDAVAVLIAQADPDALSGEQKALVPRQQEAFDGFWDLVTRIRAAKAADPARWLTEKGMTELAGRLQALKASDRDRYERFAAVLRDALQP